VYKRQVGDLPELGGWDVQRAPSLAWGEGDVWTGELALPPNSSPSFKFVVCTKKEAVEWEAGENRSTGGAAAVEAVFGDSVGSSSTKVVGHRDAGPGRSEDDDEEDGGHGVAASRVHPADSLVLALAGEKGKWQGAEVTFMRSNAHTGDRRGTWKPEGLPGAARALVEGDMCVPAAPGAAFRKCGLTSRPLADTTLPCAVLPRHRRAGSWLQKLEVVAELVGADRSQARVVVCVLVMLVVGAP
jgi:hypothetical protein